MTRPARLAAAGRLVVRLPRLLVVALIRVYQLVISPWTPPSCRYYPSCSSYALGAVQTHGVVRGGWLGVRRLLRCHPWSAGGLDPVPPARPRRHAHRHDAGPVGVARSIPTPAEPAGADPTVTPATPATGA